MNEQQENKPLISLQNVTKTYGEKTVVDDLSLDISEGEFVTILGESGCGKSTLLKIINGLITPESGSVSVNGQKIATPAPAESKLVKLRRDIGYAVQGSVLFPHLDVAQNIGFVLTLDKKSKPEIAEAVERARKIAGVEKELLTRLPGQLSGGQAQRVGIARSIAARPKLLLMDEPFGAVDEITRRSLQDELSRIVKQEALTCLFVTHDTAEALKLGSKVLILKTGKIEQYDTPEKITQQPATPYVNTLVNR
ncbi:ABC transporter ATP-binding protein [Actinomycetaceae bacterium TAE3-ERU4]|nr:ABC transporter ATP-binding protein [Actinomycetaceae bacterium TAE3-ERU4]